MGKRKREVHVAVSDGASDDARKKKKKKKKMMMKKKKEEARRGDSEETASDEPEAASAASPTRITKSRAKSEFKLSDADLADLDVVFVRNPHYRSAPDMQLFLMEEVTACSEAKLAAKQHAKAAKAQVEYGKRLATLLKAKVDVDAVTEPNMIAFVLGDYTDPAVVKPKRRVTVLKRRFRGYCMLKTHLPNATNLHVRTDLCTLMEGLKLKKRDIPVRVITNMIFRAIRTTHLFCFVLSLDHMRLALGEFLLPDDMVTVKEAFRGHPSGTQAITKAENTIAATMQRELNAYDAFLDAANFSVTSESRRKSKLRMKQYPYHPVFGVRGMTAQLHRMAAEPKQKRRRRLLAAALSKHGLALRPDSKFCAAFIGRSTLASCGEVVATMRLSRWLFRYGHVVWSNLHTKFEDHMCALVMRKRLSWGAAVEKIMNNGNFQSQCESQSRHAARRRFGRGFY